MSEPISDILEQAAEAYKRGCLVAIPTETVYGLAAPINNPDLLKKIFTLKERPAFDPLIVHISHLDQVKPLVTHWPEVADVLAESFWPGPLTMVLPKTDAVTDLITSGLPTVALRWPNHPIALGLIDKLSSPIAAPSANKFGRTSPTTAEHVRREFDAEDVLVLEGGATQVGLESTIVKIQSREGEPSELSILRPGMISQEDMSQALTNAGLAFHFVLAGTDPEAPGQMEHHYMPRIPLLLVNSEDRGKNLLSQCSRACGMNLCNPKELWLDDDAKLAARELYGQLRELSDSDADCIFFFKKAEHAGLYWEAVFDRLQKASTVNLTTNHSS